MVVTLVRQFGNYRSIWQKKSLLTLRGIKTIFNTLENVLQVRFSNAVVHLSSVLLAGQEPAALHQPQVLGRHRCRELTGFRQFCDRMVALQEHLDHPHPMRVSQDAETLRSL